MRYVIFTLAEETTRDLAECLEYVNKQHPEWESSGVVVGAWSAAVAMVLRGLAEVILVAQRSRLPADRLPRVVSVEEELAARPSVLGRLARRRPRPMG